MKRRLEPEVTGAYRKDPEVEAFLAKFNRILSSPQEAEYLELPEIYPTLHIVGVPRSGTTLLTQLLAAHTNVGYINHLVAAFWRAPVYGIRLSKKLLGSRNHSSYLSDFGRTKDISEPHEFGYFWSSMLDYEDMQEQGKVFEKKIDWERLSLVLRNMTHAFGRPIAFKSFLLGWHMVSMQRAMPKTCWVRVRRDPVQNALSILHLREKVLGSKKEWASLKPKEYKWLKQEPYWRQVAGQVFYIERTHSEQLARLSADVVLDISYKELCDDPMAILQRIILMLRKNGGEVSIVSMPPKDFEYHQRPVKTHPEASLISKELISFALELYDE